MVSGVTKLVVSSYTRGYFGQIENASRHLSLSKLRYDAVSVNQVDSDCSAVTSTKTVTEFLISLFL